jgi:carboxymethylenebutenolidase
MGEHVQLRASDGFELDAYVARPAGDPIAGLVVVQEAFGVNGHIRSVADGYAKDGFLAVAPALFDRVERGVGLNYTGEDMQKGMGLIRQGDTADRVKDVAAALDYARQLTGKKGGVIQMRRSGTTAARSPRMRPKSRKLR